VIVWLNGTFGAGKSSTANHLVRVLPHARVYDPEIVGYMLGHVLTEPVDDFQDWPPWRHLVIQTAVQVHHYVGGILVTPMTLLRRDYAQEIFDGLAAHDLKVHHVLMHADHDELIRRIHNDPDVTEQARRWRLEHLVDYQAALAWLTDSAEVVDTTRLTPAQTAERIASRL
jgi:chloramphenicol 3-O-phosphotransferase